ncbi:MAG: L,D-transpeptidase [Sulfurovaceae bacterium]|nr:L,D-transpeptidase [Sulfurovaceae bacterium]
MKKIIFYLVILFAVLITGCKKEPTITYKPDNTPYDIKECLNELKYKKDIKQEKIDKIVVYKSQKKLYAYKDGKVVKEFPISLGKNGLNGHKIERGDYRTPEGTYKIVRKKCDSRLFRNLLISYPSKEDCIRCKSLGKDPGGLVTIHGQPKWNASGVGDAYTLKYDWTEGCIAVPNSAMEFLWESVGLGVTIEIHA